MQIVYILCDTNADLMKFLTSGMFWEFKEIMRFYHYMIIKNMIIKKIKSKSNLIIVQD
jgi:hypothetical protein